MAKQTSHGVIQTIGYIDSSQVILVQGQCT
jgi:hypothetical protein